MNTPVDATASQLFREELRTKSVALRSGMHRDDIDDVQVIEGEDLDVAATRQVMKVRPAVDCTDEIEAADVLEAITIVPPQALASPAASSAMPALVGRTGAPGEQAWPIVNYDDAFLADLAPVSTCGVTFDFEYEAAPPMSPRRLGWLVGTTLACVVALLIGEAVAGVASPPTRVAAHAAAAVTLTTPSPSTSAAISRPPPSVVTATPPTSTIPSIDVRSLPVAFVSTIVAPASGAMLIDGKRVQGTTAVVACGRHMVKTSRKKVQRVDVPCSGQVIVR
jgi:hypothetical protein